MDGAGQQLPVGQAPQGLEWTPASVGYAAPGNPAVLYVRSPGDLRTSPSGPVSHYHPQIIGNMNISQSPNNVTVYQTPRGPKSSGTNLDPVSPSSQRFHVGNVAIVLDGDSTLTSKASGLSDSESWRDDSALSLGNSGYKPGQRHEETATSILPVALDFDSDSPQRNPKETTPTKKRIWDEGDSVKMETVDMGNKKIRVGSWMDITLVQPERKYEVNLKCPTTPESLQQSAGLGDPSSLDGSESAARSYSQTKVFDYFTPSRTD